MKKLLIIFGAIFLYLMMVINSCEVEEESEESEWSEFTTEESYSQECPEEQQDFDANRQTKRNWFDYGRTKYCLSYWTEKIAFDDSQEYRDRRMNLRYYNANSFWGKLYAKLYECDKNKIDELIETFAEMKEQYHMGRNEFADMVLTFVQDIPYVYIIEELSCEGKDDHGCMPGQLFGILSPVEFLHTLNGDCDTRAVLLYTIFKHFDFSPKIAVSQAYAHAMLLLDVATTGDYLKYQGQKFYFWETTATGWQAGIIPPDMNNINNWEIVLN